METLTVLRLLWRMRLLVIVGALAAVAAGAVATGKLGIGPFDGGSRIVWVATSEVQVDTPRPLATDAHASASTIQTQTVLLADYVTSDAARDAMARAVDIRSADLTVTTPVIDSPLRQSPLVYRTTQAVIGVAHAVHGRGQPGAADADHGAGRDGPGARDDAGALRGGCRRPCGPRPPATPATPAAGSRSSRSDPSASGGSRRAGPAWCAAWRSPCSCSASGAGRSSSVPGVLRAWRRSSPAYQCTPVGLR